MNPEITITAFVCARCGARGPIVEGSVTENNIERAMELWDEREALEDAHAQEPLAEILTNDWLRARVKVLEAELLARDDDGLDQEIERLTTERDALATRVQALIHQSYATAREINELAHQTQDLEAERDEARTAAYTLGVQCRRYREYLGDLRLEALPAEGLALQWMPTQKEPSHD
jgi:uncharacterized coiled-coil DUF342 family protein